MKSARLELFQRHLSFFFPSSKIKAAPVNGAPVNGGPSRVNTNAGVLLRAFLERRLESMLLAFFMVPLRLFICVQRLAFAPTRRDEQRR